MQNATESIDNKKLTSSERILLDVLMNPENRMKSVADICKIAKIDRATYYRAFAKQEFVDAYKKMSTDLVNQNISSVLNAFIKQAQRGSFQHGKVLLEMAGVYSEKANINLSGEVKSTNPYDELSVEELRALARKCEEDGT